MLGREAHVFRMSLDEAAGAAGVTTIGEVGTASTGGAIEKNKDTEEDEDS
jgi:hypothetical protein